MTGIIMEGRSDVGNRYEKEEKSGLNRMLDLRIFNETNIHGFFKKRGYLFRDLFRDVKMTLWKPTHDPMYIRFAPYFEMDKSGKNGREKRKRDRNSERSMRERHNEAQGHRDETNQGTKFFIKYKCCFHLQLSLL